MSAKKRILKIAAIGAGVVAFAGYFAFSTFVFNPLEGDLEADVAALVPRDVDFYAARAGLKDAFGEFPELAARDRLDRWDAWRAWLDSPQKQKLAQAMDLDRSLARLREISDQLPLGQKPVDVFGGEDLAVAGYFRGADLAQADWCAYGRCNWLGKLAVAALDHHESLGLARQGLSVRKGERWHVLSGGGLPRALHVARLRDVVMVATRPELLQQAFALESQAFADSFYQSAIYFDHVQNAERNARRDEFELYVNLRKLQDALQLKGPLPDPASQEFGEALLGRFVQLSSVKNVVGTIDVAEEFKLDLHGELSSEAITPEMARAYRGRGFDNNELWNEAARVAPADAAFFAYARLPASEALRAIVASMEPALRVNMEDLFRNTGKYQSLDALVAEVEGALKDRVAFFARPNDYAKREDDPPNDGQPTPAWALVLWPKNLAPLVALRDTIGTNSAKFGLQGLKPGDAGYYKREWRGFTSLREFHSRFVPGTGQIVTCDIQDIVVVTNHFGLLDQIISVYTQGESNRRLGDDPGFLALTRSMTTGGHVFAYANPRTLVPILRQGAQRAVEDSIVVDWRTQRASLEDKVLRERFPGQQRGRLSPEVQKQVDELVDPQLEAMEKAIRDEQVPRLLADRERQYAYLSGMRGVAALLRLDPKNFDVSVRALAPLPE
ncbi:MAG: hypothetical protein RIR65_2256 [Planctomycetota bacterium]